MIATKQGGGSWETGVPGMGMQGGNAVKLDTARSGFAGASAARVVCASQSNAYESSASEG